MADYNINAVTRRVVFSGSAGTGPYAFTFEILDENDIAVYFNATLLTLTTDYTVSINANGTGSVTIVVGTNVPTTPDGDDSITIVGARDIERTTDFVTAGDFRASAINEQLDALTIFDQQISERVDRSIIAPVTDPTTIDMTLPAKADRLGKYLAFNSTTGNPEAGPSTTDVATLASVTTDIATLADIEDGTDATDAIQTVAGISSNVSTVAGVSSSVTTVAGISANVTSVAGNASNINTVAGISADVTAVSGISSDVTTVAADGTDIGTVAGISANVTTVAGISADVTTVAGISGDVSSVAAQVVGYDFSTTTTMADPGSGNIRFNNATISSVTAIAIDDLDKNGVDQSAYIALWDDSTNTVKGTLVLRTSGGDVASFNITGLADNSGWFEVAVTHVASSGTFSAAEDVFIGFTRAGDKGADGAGSGDVSGPASATDGALVLFDGTTGKLIKDSTYLITAAGAALIDDADAAAQRTTLGLGSLATLNTVGTSQIDNNSVDGTKIALGSDAQGDLMYYNGTAWVRLAKGTASQLLAMNSGATAPEWVAPAPGGGWELIASTSNLSTGSPTTHTWTGLGGYDEYFIYFYRLRTNTAQICNVRIGTGGTPDTGSSYGQSGVTNVGFNTATSWALSAAAPNVSYYGTNVFIHWMNSSLGQAYAVVNNYPTNATPVGADGTIFEYGGSQIPLDTVHLFNAGGQAFFGGSAYIYGRMNA